MNTQDQLILWCKGESVHDVEHGQCTPDFSCCMPELQAAYHEREEFTFGNLQKKGELLAVFMERMLNYMQQKKTKKEEVFIKPQPPSKDEGGWN